MLLINKIKEFLGFEKCVMCNNFLNRKDKRQGGAGYKDGKHFGYCVNCTKKIIRDLMAGEEFRFPSIK